MGPAAARAHRGNAIQAERVEELDVVVGDIGDAAPRLASRAAVAWPVGHQVPRAKVALDARVRVALQAAARRALDAEQRSSIRVAPPPPGELAPVAQCQHAVVESPAVVRLSQLLHSVDLDCWTP